MPMADIDMSLVWRMQQDGYLMQINQLRDERDKLRMLVQDMIDKAWMLENLDLEWWFRDELRELGIEVN